MHLRIHIWHAFFALFFLLLLFCGLDYLYQAGRLSPWIPLGDFFLLALAIARLIRLFSYDAITDFIRKWFVGAAPDTFVGTLGELITCPWCTGLWFSFVVVFFYLATPLAWPVILILALASLASLFQIFANWIGWCAEHKKTEALKAKGD